MLLSCIALCTVLICFLAAAVMDYRTCRVYRLFWWIALGADILLWVCKADTILYSRLSELIFFCLLQELFFSKMYGRADCHGFCVGAVTLFCLGGSLWDFVMLMAYSFGLLFVVQAFHRNINRRGNLKSPVPFFPYITPAFCLYLLKIL